MIDFKFRKSHKQKDQHVFADVERLTSSAHWMKTDCREYIYVFSSNPTAVGSGVMMKWS